MIEMHNCLRTVALSILVGLVVGCVAVPNSQTSQRELSFALNQQTVEWVKPVPVTSGYGLHIKLSDYGLKKMRHLEAQRPRHIVFMVDGAVLSREMSLGVSTPREFKWVKQIGVDELTKEEADTLTQQIRGQ